MAVPTAAMPAEAHPAGAWSDRAVQRPVLAAPGHRPEALDALDTGRPAVVVTVWEPGLAAVAMATPDDFGTSLPPDPATVEAVDRAQRDHASTVAAEGAELAGSLGLAAEAQAVPDELDVAETVIEGTACGRT